MSDNQQLENRIEQMEANISEAVSSVHAQTYQMQLITQNLQMESAVLKQHMVNAEYMTHALTAATSKQHDRDEVLRHAAKVVKNLLTELKPPESFDGTEEGWVAIVLQRHYDEVIALHNDLAARGF